MKKHFHDFLLLTVAGGTYFLTAEAVFAFRHPWATETERLVYTREVLLFRTVNKDEK